MVKCRPLGDPIVLRPKKSRWTWVLVLSVAFVALGVEMIAEGQRTIGLACVAFFGLGVLTAIVQFLPGASFIRITRDGFVVRSLFHTHPFVPWVDVSEFRVARTTDRPQDGRLRSGGRRCPSANRAA